MDSTERKVNVSLLYELRSFLLSRDVEAVDYFLHPLPASYKVSRFQVEFASSFFIQSSSASTKI